ncbi:MAG: DUF1080 domain-containing protein [Chitinophagaceae bacterium]|nr:DUF1080 domain-containing protein [Chitinophagaceae bacterium]
MKRISLFLFAALLMASCTSTQNNSGSSGTWKTILKQNSTKGWHVYNQKTAGNFWKVQDGVLYPDKLNEQQYKKEEIGDLVTDEEYGDFELELEWKISEKGNSGIIFYVKEDKQYEATYLTGPEMQVLDNGTPTRPGHSDSRLYTHRAGDLYDMIASKEAVRPLGEWNRIIIRSKNGKLDFYMNGEHVLSTRMWDQNWKDMIAISKFKYMPDFGKFKTGRIALQYHGDEVWYRNIRIRRI